MMTRHGSSGHAGSKLAMPFCRLAELAEIEQELQRTDCSAIFLSSEMGLGATSLLRELAKSSAEYCAVIFIQGTPSLASIPFGILAPYLKRTSDAFVVSHVDAIRKTLALLESQEAVLRARLGDGAALGRPLLVIDEADHIDKATAEVAVSLAQAGKINVVIAHRAAKDPVEPLPQLWDAGLAERFHLLPLTREDGHKYCEGVLGGRTSANTSWYLWNTAGGNPLLMWLVMTDAVANGRLKQKGDLWVVEMKSMPAGHELRDVVTEQLRGLSPAALQTLNLVALAEPVSAGIVGDMLGLEPIAELQERHLLHESSDGSGQLQLINPVYGDVIRGMVPRAQSLMLHTRLIDELDAEPFNPESLLRRVIWALDSGLAVSDDKLLQAAVHACKLYESSVAIRLSGEIKSPEFLGLARIVKARAKYNMGDYAAAAILLGDGDEAAESVSELMFGGLLRAATQSALGLPVDSIHDDANRLRRLGEELDLGDAADAEDMLWRSRERADVLDLMAYSRSGRYAEMELPIRNVLANTARDEDLGHLFNRSIALAMDAERLSALGSPMRGREKAAAAFAITQAEDHDVYFLPEMIITRAQAASFAAGQWNDAEQFLQNLAVDVGRATISFGGSVSVARGMMMLRQGKSRAALDVLSQAVEALQHSDPQQLLGYCIALGSYAAASCGLRETTERLLPLYREDTGMYLVVSHERAFIAAAREHHYHDGAGLAELLRLADEAAEGGLLTLELNALALALDFEPNRLLARLREVAGQVEGTWASGLAAYADALEGRNAPSIVAAGEQLLEAQLYQHAGKAFRLAGSLLAKDRQGHLSRRVRQGLDEVDSELATGEEESSDGNDRQARARKILTRRELEIALLAAQGVTDRHIADRLHVSVRTVEGHLYRSYAKLGITARNDLPLVLSD